MEATMQNPDCDVKKKKSEHVDNSTGKQKVMNSTGERRDLRALSQQTEEFTGVKYSVEFNDAACMEPDESQTENKIEDVESGHAVKDIKVIPPGMSFIFKGADVDGFDEHSDVDIYYTDDGDSDDDMATDSVEVEQFDVKSEPAQLLSCDSSVSSPQEVIAVGSAEPSTNSSTVACLESLSEPTVEATEVHGESIDNTKNRKLQNCSRNQTKRTIRAKSKLERKRLEMVNNTCKHKMTEYTQKGDTVYSDSVLKESEGISVTCSEVKNESLKRSDTEDCVTEDECGLKEESLFDRELLSDQISDKSGEIMKDLAENIEGNENDMKVEDTHVEVPVSENHQNSNSEPVPEKKCEICGARLATQKRLYNHLRYKHNKGIKHYKCEICFYTTPYLSTFKRHKEMHEYSEKKQKTINNDVISEHMCDQCGKCFASRGSLITHVRAHTNPQSYNCTLCEKSFSQKGNLKGHLLRHQKQEERKQKAEDDLSSVKNTGKLKPSAYPCKLCSKVFRWRGDLSRHVKTVHFGIKNFGCDQCGKTFADISALRKHQFNHTGTKPFHCTDCKKCYSSKDSLEQHRWNKHKQKQQGHNGAVSLA